MVGQTTACKAIGVIMQIVRPPSDLTPLWWLLGGSGVYVMDKEVVMDLRMYTSLSQRHCLVKLELGSSSFPDDAEDEEEEGFHPADKVRQMKQLMSAMEVAYQSLKKKYHEESKIWKKRCDLEPLNHDEIARGLTSVVDFDSSLKNEQKIVGADSSEKQFKFYHIFRPKDNQEAVFEQTSHLHLVVSVLARFNVCILAYGQTGTGKTFTMEGTAKNKGVNYRTLEKLFSLSKERGDTMRLKVMLSTEGNHEVPALSERVNVVGEDLVNGKRTRSRLWLVDLVGSVRVGKVEVEGERLTEAQLINDSLSSLGDVISA
ncbi:kinesin-like protein KIN-14S [Tanacetum coccineum]